MWGASLRLRHANTGRYLALERAFESRGGPAGGHRPGAASETSSHPTAACLFKFAPTALGTLGAVPIGSGVRLVVSGGCAVCF